eukprot:4407318-Alexandrium_andersonii.AAC.1
MTERHPNGHLTEYGRLWWPQSPPPGASWPCLQLGRPLRLNCEALMRNPSPWRCSRHPRVRSLWRATTSLKALVYAPTWRTGKASQQDWNP